MYGFSYVQLSFLGLWCMFFTIFGNWCAELSIKLMNKYKGSTKK